MSKPITPKFYADTVVGHRIQLNYHPVWDGSNWVITPADVTVIGFGKLTDDGIDVLSADLEMKLTDLPSGGQSAIQQLLQFVEAEMAIKYS
jgi:hypothetical protein